MSQPTSAQNPAERTFTSFDGTNLFFRHWSDDNGKQAVILLHRGHEHGGRVAHLADELGLEDTQIYALDARGHGRSQAIAGGVPTVADLARDLDCFVRHIHQSDGIATPDIAIVAQSIGAVVATSWVHDYAPPIRSMVLAAPAFDVDLRVPFARTGLAAATALVGSFVVNSRVTPEELTQDPERQSSYLTDPLITPAIQTELLLDLKSTADRVIDDAMAIAVPTQVLIAGKDNVVRPAATKRFFDRLGAPQKDIKTFENLRHDLLGEQDRRTAVTAVSGFLSEQFTQSLSVQNFTQADQAGFTKDEADILQRPLPFASLRGLCWRGAKAVTRLGATFSQGLAVGAQTGFDSGEMLDYVYENDPQGSGPLGRLVDRAFLDAVGWRGIRQRKHNLEDLFETAQNRLRQQAMHCHVVDIAAGHGRYVLDAVEAAETKPDTVLLRDYCLENVLTGRQTVESRGLGALVLFERANAFDFESLASLTPKPTLAIASGLYELFPANQPVRTSLAGLAEAMPAGGVLLYTNQPYHPQLEQIARTLTSHRDGQSWVMRRRTQLEMDQLISEAGFQKIEQRIDRWGIFTVSLAVRVSEGAGH